MSLFPCRKKQSTNMSTLIPVEIIAQTAYQIMRDLGAGYSESCYQNALYNKFVKIDPSTQKEVIIPVIYDGEPIGTCRADLVTAENVIEIKATRTMPTQVNNQIRKYMVNLRMQDSVPRFGIILNFNQDSENLEIKIIPPSTLPNEMPSKYKRRKYVQEEEDESIVGQKLLIGNE